MVTITSDAMSILRRVTTHPRSEAGQGVRIASGPDRSASLDVRVVPAPEPGDTVVERDGGLLYLDPVAAERIAGHELDTETAPDGRVQFIARAVA